MNSDKSENKWFIYLFIRYQSYRNRHDKTVLAAPASVKHIVRLIMLQTSGIVCLDMSDYLLILIGAALINNFVLTKFLGLCPFFGTSQKIETAFGMALATMFVLTVSAGISYLLHRYLLIPFNLTYLKALIFIVVIASFVQLTEMILRATNPLLHSTLGIFLPLITTNCAVLGVALINMDRVNSFMQALLTGLGAAAGFALVLIVFSELRRALENAAVPAPLRGSGIAMVTAGIMSLAFTGFEGLAY